MKNFLKFLLIPLGALLASCGSGQVKAKHPVAYRYEPGKSAYFHRNASLAYAPQKAPTKVSHAIQAGNRLQGKPYKWGGGHANEKDRGYDCSGTVSYVLREAGLLKGSMTSRGFMKYGSKGPGKWITVYANDGHVFMTVAGLRLDTGGRGGRTGPRWKPESRNAKGYVMRHPPGF